MAVTVERLQAEVDADPSGAVRDLAVLEAALDAAARDRKATIDVDVDNGAAQARAAMDAIGDVAHTTADALGGVQDILSEVVDSLPSLGKGFDDVGGAAGGSTTVINNMSSGMGGLVTSLLMAIPQLGLVAVALSGLYAAATIVVGALQMLAAAAAGVYGALAPLVGLLGAIPVGLGAIGGGIGTVIMGFSGITKAMSVMDSVQAAGVKSTYNATAAARDLKSARQGIVDANKAVTRAEEELKRATEGVAEAQKQAQRDLIEQRRAVRNAVWAEEDAVDRLKRAQENLAKAQAGVGKSGALLSKETDDFTGKVYEVARVSADAVDGYDAQKDAQRELIRAQEELTRAQERRKDLQEDLAEAEKKGVKGSDVYKNAIRRQEDAQNALSRAHDNVAAATERLARVQEEQARRAAGGTAANNALAAAMDKLTETGRNFVRFLHGEFMPAWKTVTDAAQEGLLPGVEKGLRDLMLVFPVMADEAKKFAVGIGDEFAKAMKHFTSDDVIADLKELSTLFRDVLFGDNKKVKGFMDAIIPLGDILISITKAAGPMTKMLTTDIVNGLKGLSDWMKQPKNAKKMEDFFNTAYKFTKLWWRVLKPVVGALGTLAKAAEPLATWMLEGIAGSLEGLDKKMKDPKGFAALTQWFEDMKPAIKETVGLFGDLIKAIFAPEGQGKEDSPFTRTMKALREDFVPALERLFDTLGKDNKSGPAFVGLLTQVVEALTTLVEHPEYITEFIENVRDIIATLDDFLETADKITNSKMWDVLAVLTGASWGHIFQMWKRIGEENNKGINEWEAYTRPKLEGVLKKFANALNMVPIIGPILSRVFTWLTGKWLDIIGIFTSGDIGGALKKKFDGYAVDIRRAFAKALNPIIEAANKVLGFLKLPLIKYIDAYVPSGQGNTGKSMGGGAADDLSGRPNITRTVTSTTRINPGMRAFGGPVRGGQDYIVGEKRPELLRLPEGVNGRIAAAVPRPMTSTGGGLTEQQLDRVLNKVLDKAKPNVDMKVEQREFADANLLARDLEWALR